MKKTIVKASLLGASYLLAAGAIAANNTILNGDLYIAPGLNIIDAHNMGALNKATSPSDKLERTLGLNLSLGYQFDNPWAVELMYQYNKPDFKRSSGKMKLNHLHLDGLYSFDIGSSRLTPYAVAGIGKTKYDSNIVEIKETMFNAGLGVKYAFMENLYGRIDGRATVGTSHGDLGASINAALVYVFGKHNSVKPAPIVIEAAPQPEPEPITLIVVDSDGDGVPDNLDECPNTPAEAKVDAKGCALILTETKEFNLNVKFAVGSASIQEDSKDDVKKLAKFLREYPETKVEIEGHSDSTGSAALNKRLSQSRAESVMRALIEEHHVDEKRISAKGFGSERPIADNGTAEGRAQNRRVVAKVLANVERFEMKN